MAFRIHSQIQNVGRSRYLSGGAHQRMATVFSISALFLLGACGTTTEAGNSLDAATNEESAAVTTVAGAWPSSLNVVGDGFPTSGAPCRIIGETAATVDFLDDSATLVGCLAKADADKLGGKQVGVVDGVTLVSVPGQPPRPGDGDGQGDAKVAGTEYNATAQIKCAGYKGAPAGMCEAGVNRAAETGPYIDVTLPGGGQRTLFFEKSGKFLTINSNQADGSAAYVVKATRSGDTQIITAGPERYEVPDAFVQGD